MKLFLVCALVVFALASVEGRRGGRTNPLCDQPCSETHDPVCAQDTSVKGGKPTTFNNECLMDKYNCDRIAQMNVIYKGECESA